MKIWPLETKFDLFLKKIKLTLEKIISHGDLIGLRKQKPQLIKSGDTVWIPPNEEHWHGATATNAMVHIAIQEALNESVALWLEKVTEEDYIYQLDFLSLPN